MKKNTAWPIWAVGIAAAAGLYFAAAPRNESSLEKSYPTRAPGEVRPAPVYHIPSNDVFVDMIPPGESIENSRGVLVRLNERHVQSLAQYAPVWYEITGLKNFKVSIPVDKGQSLAAVEFASQLSLEGKTLMIFGMDPHTQQRATLFEKKFVGKREYY
jgi:hypothetical protein